MTDNISTDTISANAEVAPRIENKRNTALVSTFVQLAHKLGASFRVDSTHLEYDSLATGRRPLKNALCIKERGTSFFTSDRSLPDRLVAAGFIVKPAPFRNQSQHSEYRYRVSNVFPTSIDVHADLFAQVVKDSIGYVENPIAGHSTKHI